MKIILSLYKRLFFVLLACLPISLMAQTVINSDGIRYLIENDHALIENAIKKRNTKIRTDFIFIFAKKRRATVPMLVSVLVTAK